MKYAIFFAFAIFAFVAQANARSVVVDESLDESLDRGAIADALKAKLAQAKEKLNKLFNRASDVLKKKIAEVVKKAALLIYHIKQKAGAISNEVYQAAQKVLDKVGEIEDKVIEEAKEIVEKFGHKKPQKSY